MLAGVAGGGSTGNGSISSSRSSYSVNNRVKIIMIVPLDITTGPNVVDGGGGGGKRGLNVGEGRVEGRNPDAIPRI